MESPDKVRTLESLSANAADAVVGVNFASLKVSIQKVGPANKSVPQDLLLYIRENSQPKLIFTLNQLKFNFAEMPVVCVTS